MRYFAAIRPDLAARFIDEVDAGFELIKQDPQRWRIVHGSIRRVLTKGFPIALLYVIEGKTVHIVAVAAYQGWAERRAARLLSPELS